jgi:hypothetical protein
MIVISQPLNESLSDALVGKSQILADSAVTLFEVRGIGFKRIARWLDSIWLYDSEQGKQNVFIMEYISLALCALPL